MFQQLGEVVIEEKYLVTCLWADVMVLKHFKFVLQQDTAYEHNSYFLSQAYLHEHIKPRSE